jgi:hypothetical protein
MAVVQDLGFLSEHPVRRIIYLDMLELFAFPQIVEMKAKKELPSFSNRMRGITLFQSSISNYPECYIS